MKLLVDGKNVIMRSSGPTPVHRETHAKKSFTAVAQRAPPPVQKQSTRKGYVTWLIVFAEEVDSRVYCVHKESIASRTSRCSR